MTRVEQHINGSSEQTAPIVFIRIDAVFQDSLGELTIDQPTNIEISDNSYMLSIDQASRQLKISAIFKCGTYRKTINVFSELAPHTIICIDSETNPKLKQFFDDHYYRAQNELERLFKLLRWKYTLGTGQLKYLSENIFWSLDRENWNSVVRCPPPENVQARMIEVKSLDTRIIKVLMEKGEAEPIFFELLREANSISRTNLESAFVIAVSAFEVAAKHLIKNHLPETEWLIDEIPSPPIEKIIRHLFPKLIPGLTLTESQINDLKSTISIRNKLVHSGRVGNDRETLFKFMNFINDFIREIINPNLK
jgi:hypothetical protein